MLFGGGIGIWLEGNFSRIGDGLAAVFGSVFFNGVSFIGTSVCFQYIFRANSLVIELLNKR